VVSPSPGPGLREWERGAALVLALTLATGCPPILYSSEGEGGTSDARSDARIGDAGACKSKATVCVAAAPVTWTGPVEIYEGDPATAPKCPSPLLTDVSANISIASASPVTCSACGCTPGTIACGDSTVEGLNLLCENCDAGTTTAMLGKCSNAALVCGMDYVEGLIFEHPSATAPCTMTGGSVDVRPPVEWMSAVVGCKAASSALKQIDCAAGEVCAPAPSPPFDSSLCVFQVGDVSCPGAPYSNRIVAYEGVDDARGCTACTCKVTPGTCTGTVNAFSDSDCKTPFGSSMGFGGCVEVSGSSIYAEVLTADPPTTLACGTTGGQPTGTATPANPVTICCM
jgi:hypothetical protein